MPAGRSCVGMRATANSETTVSSSEKPPSSDVRRPILVTGSHRSGTTWVGRMLAAAPGVAYLHEPFNPFHRPGTCAAHIERWFEYVPPGGASPFERPLRRTIGLEYDLGAEVAALRSPRDFGRMVRDALRFRIWKAQGRRPLVKDPIAIFSAEWLSTTFDMDVVVMIRHPAAFVGSLKQASWRHPVSDLAGQRSLVRDLLDGFEAEIAAAVDREEDLVQHGILLWRLMHHVILEYRARHPEWTFLRHEDVSRDPAPTFADLYRRLGLQLSASARATIERHTAAYNPTEARNTQDLLRDSRENVQNWKRRLDASEIERIRAGTADIWPKLYSDDEW